MEGVGSAATWNSISQGGPQPAAPDVPCLSPVKKTGSRSLLRPGSESQVGGAWGICILTHLAIFGNCRDSHYSRPLETGPGAGVKVGQVAVSATAMEVESGRSKREQRKAQMGTDKSRPSLAVL